MNNQLQNELRNMVHDAVQQNLFTNAEFQRFTKRTFCIECLELISITESWNLSDDTYVCIPCKDAHYLQCHSCESFRHNSGVEYRDMSIKTEGMWGMRYTTDSNLICDICIDDKYDECDECQRVFTYTGKDVLLPEWDASRLLCHECQQRYSECADCSNTYDIPHMIHVYGDTYLCRNCMDNNHIRCHACGDITHNDFSYYDEYSGNDYCESCYRDITNNDRILGYHNSYDLSFIRMNNGHLFHDSYARDDTLYLGCEIEIECDSRNESAELIHDSMPDIFHVMEDGSLSNGIEMISNPVTLNAHKSMYDEYDELFNSLVSNGDKSHDTSTCGMHIHVSRGILTRYQELALAYLWYSNDEFTIKFCRREYNNYAEKKDCNSMCDADSDDRYSAINFENSNTIEFRHPRGTLKTSTFIATLEFINGMVEYMRNISESDIPSIRGILDSIDYSECECLQEYLNTRGLMNYADNSRDLNWY